MLFLSRCSKCHTFIYAKSLVKDRFFIYKSCLREKRKSSLFPEQEALPR